MSEVTVKKEARPARFPGFGPLFPASFHMSPFARQMTEEMDKLFGVAKAAPNGEEVWAPAVEVRRNNGKLVVTAELPGLKKDEIKVKIVDAVLILEGERKQEKEEKKEGYYHSERSYGHFYRAIPLPEGAHLDKVSAEFTNGLIEVSIPVPEAKPISREVPVQEGGKTKTAGG